jgi:hypothetical protein
MQELLESAFVPIILRHIPLGETGLTLGTASSIGETAVVIRGIVPGVNTLKYTDPDGKFVKNNTRHWIYVKFENPIPNPSGRADIPGKLIAPGETFGDKKTRVDGVIVYDKKNDNIIVKKVPGRETGMASLYPVVSITVNQDSEGNFEFETENAIPFTTREYSEKGPSKISDKNVAEWVMGAKDEAGDPRDTSSKWGDLIERTNQPQKTADRNE